ncbi:ABC transporter permease [Maribellus maritimus]|uniref:ABC transporter permease n=1 Tax=Maribellus maritimus TaxID=2870838 RepID=UPI001EEAA4EA|nr:ABC transporter permease [Maribellus maritimus]MCG6189914.1 ABC transporter permease [Maribellus maritimus]
MKTYNLKLTLRRFSRDKIGSSINIFGLAFGLAVTILVVFYVHNELSYESCFDNSGQIYRISEENNSTQWAAIPPTIGVMVKEQIPEIENIARLSLCKEQIVKVGAESFIENNGCNADNSVSSIFSFKWLSGNSKTALSNPASIVLTQSLAKKYFNKNDALGKTVEIDENTYTVTGIIENLPSNTHLKFNYFLSLSENYDNLNRYGKWQNFYTYCSLNKSVNTELVTTKLNDFAKKYTQLLQGSENTEISLALQPINKIHLFSKLEKEIPGNGNILYLFIFSIIAALILFISCANYINLSVIKTLKRVNEFGVKKVLGASKKSLVLHFFHESFIYVLIATVFALAIVFLFNENYGYILGLSLKLKGFNIVVVLSLLALITFLVSFYPASVVFKYNITDAIKSKKNVNAGFRKALVVFQFAASIFLIVCTLGVHHQMKYINNKNLGFDKTATISVKLYGDLYNKFKKNGDVLKNELLKNPNIVDVSLTSYELGKRIGFSTIYPLSQKNKENLPDVRVLNTDGRLISLLNMKITDGNNFTKSQTPSVILNQAAVDAYGFTNPLNEQVVVGDTKHNVVGVVQNFNYSSLHAEVEPLAITNTFYFLVNLYVKINGSNISGALTDIEKLIQTTSPGSLFAYSFLNETLGKQYQAEQNLNILLNIFTFLALFIACLGLMVLSIYSAELRIKEIGIRKVNGAKISEILTMLNKDFVKWVATAFVIATPVAYYAMNKWLENFAYKTSLSWWIFALAGVLALGIALFTVSWQSWRAATRNPVEALRYE